MDNLLADQEPQIDPEKKYYEDLVGEGKKFKDNESLARSKMHSDLHISKIEKENEELQKAYLRVMEENKAKAKLEDLIKQYDSSRQTSNANPDVKADQKQPAFDPAQLDSIFDRKIQEHDQSRKQRENFEAVKDRLIQRFGTNYQTQVKQQITDLGITEEEFNQMARVNPKLVFKTLDVDAKAEGFQNPLKGTSSFRPKVPENHPWSYWKDLYKAKPNDRNLIIQMDKDALALGEAFFDVD